MKKIISVFCALALMGSVAAFAQEKGNKKEDWREKVRSEQVALITSELDLTEAEAQAFWPVYNEVQAQRREAFQATSMALKALKKGEEGKDVNALLDQYEAAKKNCNDVDIQALARFKKVLPAEKVAKLLVAEEKFRHQQIGKLGKGEGGPRPGAPGRRSGGKPAPVMEPEMN